MNKVQRLLRLGQRAQGNERGSWWALACIYSKLSGILSDEEIGEQFELSDSTVLNARRAYDLYDRLRAVPEVRAAVRSMRKKMNKSNWEIAARHFAEHGSLGDALSDLQTGIELPVREFNDTLDQKYNGDPFPRELARQEQNVSEIVQGVWAAVDKKQVPTRVGRSVERAAKLWLGRLGQVKDGLSGDPF
jgi:hypothetical protein